MRRKLAPSLNRPVPPGNCCNPDPAEYQAPSAWTVPPTCATNSFLGVWKNKPLFQTASNLGASGTVEIGGDGGTLGLDGSVAGTPATSPGGCGGIVSAKAIFKKQLVNRPKKQRQVFMSERQRGLGASDCSGTIVFTNRKMKDFHIVGF